ncbi:hypothetical protein [Streptomyces venezuelae]|uniref:hypothetical protein n=1 Tax=Streptomyces venezuelae TaxID=54571 RepID=UPI00343A24B1
MNARIPARRTEMALPQRRRAPLSPQPRWRFSEIFTAPRYSDPQLTAAIEQEWEYMPLAQRRRPGARAR